MRVSFGILSSAGIAAMLVSAPAEAQSIDEALSAAYTQSTTLGVQRAQQRATDELVPQALSNWRPTVTATANVTYTNQEPVFSFVTPNGTAKGAAVQVTQPLYRGGRTTAQTSQATNLVESGKALLGATEQNVLLSAAQAYLDVVRDQATVDLTANNENVLRRQFDATQDRFRVGEVTRTDVALAQSSYDSARAQHVTAIGTLDADRAAYQRVIGQAPGALLAFPKFTYQLPPSLEDAVAAAESRNPSVVAAEFTERASRDAIDINTSSRLPQVNLVGSYGRAYPNSQALRALGAKTDHVDTGTVGVQMNWQLYTGGLVSSQVRQAKQVANRDLIAVEDAKRVARQTAISAWQRLLAARANIEALTSQVNAAQIAAEGTRQQALVGTATVLDSLQAEQILLQAQVNLVTAQHSELLNSYTLLASVGSLNARDLALAVKIYDPAANQDRVHDKLFGTAIK